jgi:hypothetical protein
MSINEIITSHKIKPLLNTGIFDPANSVTDECRIMLAISMFLFMPRSQKTALPAIMIRFIE